MNLIIIMLKEARHNRADSVPFHECSETGQIYGGSWIPLGVTENRSAHKVGICQVGGRCNNVAILDLVCSVCENASGCSFMICAPFCIYVKCQNFLKVEVRACRSCNLMKWETWRHPELISVYVHRNKNFKKVKLF